jgi:hypothetical protein
LKKVERLLLDCGRRSQHVERLFAHANSIVRERGQVHQQTSEAMYRNPSAVFLLAAFSRADSERCAGATMLVRCACAAAASSSSNNSGASAWRICHST